MKDEFVERVTTEDRYESLRDVLELAYRQAAYGKGQDRHGVGQPFTNQPMQHLLDLYGYGFAAGQIGKKVQEAQRLPKDKAIHELLGAIVYAAGLVIYLERQPRDEVVVSGGGGAGGSGKVQELREELKGKWVDKT